MSEKGFHWCQKWDPIGVRGGIPLNSEVIPHWCQRWDTFGVRGGLSLVTKMGPCWCQKWNLLVTRKSALRGTYTPGWCVIDFDL